MTENRIDINQVIMQRLLAWMAARSATTTDADALRKDIGDAVEADARGEHAHAVELYAIAIEKMLRHLQRTFAVRQGRCHQPQNLLVDGSE